MASGDTSFADIAPAWQTVAALLSARDLCNCIQASRQLQHLSDVEVVWQSVAHRTWHQLHNPDTGGYTSYKALVLDDNRQNLALSVALHEVSCMWRYQRPAHLYYECKLLQLQWWRSDNSLRLYFDARGESDLRSPITSSLAIVALNTPSGVPSNPYGAQGSNSQDSSRTSGAAGGAGQQQQTDAAVAGDPGCWSKKLGVFYPDECQLLTNKRGHYKGVLIWSSYQCCQILDFLLPSAQCPQQQHQQLPQAPVPQHMHQQRARRSAAFEEWADWQLSHQDDVNAAVGGPPVMHTAGGPLATAGTSQPAEPHSTSGSTGQPASSSSSAHGGGASSSSNSSASLGGWLDGIERRLMSQLGKVCGRDGGSSSNSGSGDAPAAPVSQSTAAGSQPGTSASAMVATVSQEQSQQLALVFCYANNLADADGGPFGLPDYSIEPLLVVPPYQPAGTTEASAGAATVDVGGADAGGAATQPATTIIPQAAADQTHVAVADDGIALEGEGVHVPTILDHEEYLQLLHDLALPPDPDHLQLLHDLKLPPDPDHLPADVDIRHPIHTLGVGLPGLLFPHMPGPAPYNMLNVHHMSTEWVAPGNAAVREGSCAAEWLKLPGAALVARGMFYNELQDETEDEEVAGWSNLPEAVKRRGKAWWV